jgi:hypothetical protein
VSASRRARAAQLAEVLDGDLDPADARAEVRALAELAGGVAPDLPRPVLPADARDRIRERVMAEVHLGLVDDRTTAPTRVGRPRAAVATGLASLLIASGGVAVAAQEALPGDTLYGLKKATESVRVAVAGAPADVSRLELALAAERLQEVRSSNARGDVAASHYVDTLREMDRLTVAGIDGLTTLSQETDDGELLLEAARFTDTQFAGLSEIFRDLPVTVRPNAEDSLALLRELREQRIDPLLERCEECLDLLSPAGTTTGVIIDPLVSDPLPAAPEPPPEAPSPPSPDAPAPRGPATDPSPPQPQPAPQPLPEVEVPDVQVPGSGGGGGGGDEPRRVVPRLPGPLDDVGGAVDDTLGPVLDDTGEAVDDLTGTVDDALDGVGDGLGDVGDGVGDVVDGVGGILRPRDRG